MIDNPFHLYTGDRQYQLSDFEEDNRLNAPELYRPSPALKNAVNVAIALGRPLLVTGEPGSGKTQLAHNLAFSFGLGKPLVFNTRTSSTSTDLFYRYDALAHLHHVQTNGRALSNEEVEERFVRYQALGEALRSGKRAVVLIDEIDKAPRDLPNDILNILEDLEFEVAEIGKSYAAQPGKRPIIVMTSNSEKNLPDAFLRRVVYFHLPFPSEEELIDIIGQKIRPVNFTPEDVRNHLLPHFLFVREALKRKKPGTAELLSWITVLDRVKFPAQNLENVKYLDSRGKETLTMSYHVLAKTEEDLRILRNTL